MTEEQSIDEEKIRHRFLLSSIYENERIFIYTYAYGALSIFIYLVSKELEHGYLLSITNVFIYITTIWCYPNFFSKTPFIFVYKYLSFHIHKYFFYFPNHSLPIL